MSKSFKITILVASLGILVCLFVLAPPADAETVEILSGYTLYSSTAYGMPYNTYYHDARYQSLFLASDLTAEGMSACTITSIWLGVYTTPGYPISNFQIRLKQTSDTTQTSFDNTGWTLVYGPTDIEQPTGGYLYEYTLHTPFNWDGTSNLLVDISRDNSDWTDGGAMYVRGEISNRACYDYFDSTAGSPNDWTGGVSYSYLPMMQITYTAGTPGLWKGVTSSDWNTSSNWDDGNVPDETVDVTIPTGCTYYPIISGFYFNINFAGTGYECKSLTIESGASFTTNDDFNIKGTITADGGTLNTNDTEANWTFRMYSTANVTVKNGGIINVPNQDMYAYQDVCQVTIQDALSEINIGGKLDFKSSNSGNGGGKLTISNGTLNTDGNINLGSASELAMSGGEIHCAENFNIYTTGFTCTGGTIYMDTGDGTSFIGLYYDGAGPYFNDLVINNTMVYLDRQDASGTEYLDVNGNLTINSTKKLDVKESYGTLQSLDMTVAGNWSNSGTFESNTGTVTFDGSAAQTIGGSSSTTFYNLTVASPSGVSLGISTTVAGGSSALTLTNGLLLLSNYDLTLSNTAATIGGTPAATKMVVTNGTGKLYKAFATGASSFTFPIGDITGTVEYSLVTLDFTANAVAGNVGVIVTDANHPNLNTPSAPTDYLSRYWSFTTSGLTTYTYSMTCYYTDPDINGTEANLKVSRWDASAWTELTSSVTPASNYISFSGLSNATAPLNANDYAGRVNPDTTAPTFTIQYYSDTGLTSSLGDNPRLKAGTYYIKITSDEALSGTPTITIAAEGTANDVTNAATILVSGNIYKYTRTISTDGAAVGSVLENISITGTDSASNTATNVDPTNEATKAAYTDTTLPTFTIQYYSDTGLTSSLGDNPRLKAGTYYIKITSNEALSGTPTITIGAEGTANDVTGASIVSVSGNDYKYTRTIVTDGAAVGSVLEDISITGTDSASNTATNVDPTNEATKAAYTDTTAPTVAITAPLTETWVNGDTVITFTDTEQTAPECSIDDTNWVSCVSGTTTLADVTDFAGLAEEASFTLYLKDTDAAGNTGTDSESGIIKDTTAPSAPVMQLEPSTTAGPTNKVSWDEVTDAGVGGIEYYAEYATADAPSPGEPFSEPRGHLDWIAATYEFTVTVPTCDPKTTYYYHVKAKDAAGNESAYSTSVSSEQNCVIPLTTFTFQIDRSVNFDTDLITKPNLPVQVDGKGTYTLTDDENLVDGITYHWHVKTIDGAGNESDWSSPWSIHCGLNTAPSATVPGSISQYENGSGYVSFQTEISDVDSDVCKLMVEYSDDNGSTWYDPLLVSVSGTGAALNNDNPYQISGISTSAANTLTIVWDTKSASNQNGALTGDQTDIKVRVTPYDGTADGTTQTSPAFRVDNEVPTSSPIITAPTDQTKVKNNDVITVGGTVEANSTEVSATLRQYSNLAGTDKVAYVVVSADVDISGTNISGTISLGTLHADAKSIRLEYIVKDAAGNESVAASSRSVTLGVDNTAPTLTANLSASNPEFSPDASSGIKDLTILKFTSNEDAKYTITINEVGGIGKIRTFEENCTAATEVSENWYGKDDSTPRVFFGEDKHTASVTVTDAAGNITNGATIIIILDNTAPSAPTLSSPLDGHDSSDATPDFTWTKPDDLSGIDLYTLQIYEDELLTQLAVPEKTVPDGAESPHYQLLDSEALSEGEYWWRVSATDKAGNDGNPTPSPYKIIITPSHAVVINEIMWMGSQSSPLDQWIELRNTDSQYSAPIGGWKIYSGGTELLTIPTTKIIPAGGYFIISNRGNTYTFAADITDPLNVYAGGECILDSSFDNIPADEIWTIGSDTIKLSDVYAEGGQCPSLLLELYNNNDPRELVDTAGNGTSPVYFGGERMWSIEGSFWECASMERYQNSRGVNGASTDAWYTSTSKVNIDTTAQDYGSPGAPNGKRVIDRYEWREIY